MKRQNKIFCFISILASHGVLFSAASSSSSCGVLCDSPVSDTDRMIKLRSNGGEEIILPKAVATACSTTIAAMLSPQVREMEKRGTSQIIDLSREPFIRSNDLEVAVSLMMSVYSFAQKKPAARDSIFRDSTQRWPHLNVQPQSISDECIYFLKNHRLRHRLKLPIDFVGLLVTLNFLGVQHEVFPTDVFSETVICMLGLMLSNKQCDFDLKVKDFEMVINALPPLIIKKMAQDERLARYRNITLGYTFKEIYECGAFSIDGSCIKIDLHMGSLEGLFEVADAEDLHRLQLTNSPLMYNMYVIHRDTRRLTFIHPRYPCDWQFAHFATN